MKLILSTIVVGIVLFLLGWLFYGMLFADFFKEQYGHISRSQGDMKIWAFGVASFVQAFFLYLIYAKGYQGGSPIMEGFRFGLLIAFFSAIPYVLFTWGGMPVTYQAVIRDGIIIFVMMLIAGILTGVIHGKKEVKPAATT
ncbi:MAG TPA: hypothetical protein VGK25_03820 [Ignavibacteria bacterium]|jgi:hypothetical protein